MQKKLRDAWNIWSRSEKMNHQNKTFAFPLFCASACTFHDFWGLPVTKWDQNCLFPGKKILSFFNCHYSRVFFGNIWTKLKMAAKKDKYATGKINYCYLLVHVSLFHFDKALLIPALVWLLAFCFGNAHFFQALRTPSNPKSKYEKFPSIEQYVW